MLPLPQKVKMLLVFISRIKRFNKEGRQLLKTERFVFDAIVSAFSMSDVFSFQSPVPVVNKKKVKEKVKTA